jgi:hypothetical protein
MTTPLETPIPESVRWLGSIVVPALSGLFGVVIGAWLTSRRDRAERKLDFVAKQVHSFYSPMLGLRSEVRTESAVRLKVQAAASAAWAQICADANERPLEVRERISTERGPEFTKLIEYDNAKLHEKVLPAYRKMVDLFRENYALADPETQSYYQSLVEFVDGWNRWVEKALPTEVLKRLDHGEGNLEAFYEHLERKHAVLRRKLSSGEV